MRHTNNIRLCHCERKNNHVYFTDVNGHIMHTSTDCKQPRRAVNTSWGHILIGDVTGEVKLVNEAGGFLGNLRDNNGSFSKPVYIYVDETERLLYVASAEVVDDHQVRTYNCTPSDLPQLPLRQTVTDMTVNVKLAKA